jgi:Methyltransferase domain
MVYWLAKALVQRSIGALPNPHYWNEVLQNRVMHSLDLTRERFEASLCNCRNHLQQLRRFCPEATSSGFSAFELGTGWFPTVAIGLSLSGAREVWTSDIVPLLRRDRLKHTLRRFLEFEEEQQLSGYLHVLPERLDQLREVMALCDQPNRGEPADLLERLGIHYRIGRAGQTGLPSQSVDLIVSDVVLEHLTPQELTAVLQEFRRIAAPHGVLSHTISLDDQYATRDPGITPFNFLRFSDRVWRLLNNPIIPLNRLRVSDYRTAFKENGFQVVDETDQRGHPADLARTPLAARFRDYPVEDLLVIHTWLVAIPQHT